VHCESSRQLGFALSYTLPHFYPQTEKKTVFMVTSGPFFWGLFRLYYTGRTACTEPQCLYKGALYCITDFYNYYRTI